MSSSAASPTRVQEALPSQAKRHVWDEQEQGNKNGKKSLPATVAESSPREKKRTRIVTTTPDYVSSEQFAVLEAPHPYGVLPGGNRFLEAQGQRETSSLMKRSPSDVLNHDECWQTILSFCDGPDLGRLGSTCRFFYVVGHQPELWRDLCLRKCQASVISQVGPSWRDTYVQLVCPSKKITPHKPMAVPGVYSDYFYRLHSCRSFAIPPSWLERDPLHAPCTVPRVAVTEMTEKEFRNKYEEPNRPVLISGAALQWKAYSKWPDRAYCQQHTVGRTFRATSGAAILPGNFTLDAYFDYCDCSSSSNHHHLLEEAPLYLFDRTALLPGSELWKDYMSDLQRDCPYWDPERASDNGHDLFQVLGEGQRPDHTWLIVGPRRSGSVFHIDPNATHAWNAAICGRKRWLFYPPGVSPPGIHPSEDGDEVALPLSIGEWLFQFWDEHVECKRSAPPHERPLECTALPGDVVFVPHGWWHMVINLDELNIAVTHNYVSDSNLSNVLKFLDTKRDQVSGCRDRDESIKPEELYERFVEATRKRYPECLERALAQPKWTCRAWKDETDQETQPGNETEKAEGPTRKAKTSLMEQAKGEAEGFKFSFL